MLWTLMTCTTVGLCASTAQAYPGAMAPLLSQVAPPPPAPPLGTQPPAEVAPWPAPAPGQVAPVSPTPAGEPFLPPTPTGPNPTNPDGSARALPPPPPPPAWPTPEPPAAPPAWVESPTVAQAESPRETIEEERPWTTGTALLGKPYYEVGLGFGLNGPVGAKGELAAIGLTSVRVLENHGYLSRIVLWTLLAMAQGMSRTSCGPYGHCYTRAPTPEERAREDAALEATFAGRYLMELTVYAPGLFGSYADRPRARGFEYYLGGGFALGSIGKDPAVLQIAFSMASVVVDDVPFAAGQGPNPAGKDTSDRHLETVKYGNCGVMTRLSLPIGRYLAATLQWDANMLSFWHSSERYAKEGSVWTSPVRLGLMLNATDRIFVLGRWSINGFGAYALGYALEAGLRF